MLSVSQYNRMVVPGIVVRGQTMGQYPDSEWLIELLKEQERIYLLLTVSQPLINSKEIRCYEILWGPSPSSHRLLKVSKTDLISNVYNSL